MQQACGAGAEIANATGARMLTSNKINSSLAVWRCMIRISVSPTSPTDQLRLTIAQKSRGRKLAVSLFQLTCYLPELELSRDFPLC